MKILYPFYICLIILLTCIEFVSAQVSNCFDSNLSPFCSGIAQYPANFDGSGSGSGPQAPAGPNYDCLGTMGNPTYFSLTVEQTGSINFTLDNTANVDIDFVLWGPFSSISNATAACDSIGQGGQWGNVDTCSYSSITQEPVTVSNAQAGDVYILMVTNFSNVSTNIFSTQNSGSGTIACPCEIPYSIDTMPALAGNQGFLTDTSNGTNQFVVCPGNLLGIQVGSKGSLNDTLSLYAPFTSINSGFFTNNTIFTVNPNLPFYDSLSIFATITPQQSEIGVNNFTLGVKNNMYTGGLTDSSCFDQISVQVVVPGVKTTDRNICSGEIFQLQIDSIPTTSLGSSSYTWSQLSGPTVGISSQTVREPTITVPITSSNSSSDSVVLEVDYSYGGMCGMKDTLVLHFPDMSISAFATPDTICIGGTSNLLITLSDTLTPAICDDYDVNIIPFSPLSTSGTAVNTYTALSGFPASDEGISSALPIGFNFNFYCNNYTDFYIHTNGFITFTNITGTPGLLTGASLPSTFTPNNLIALSWEDLDVGNGGTVQYYVTGTAPNRKLVVSFTSIQNWAGSGSMTSQAILSENDNSIEIHITSNNFSTSTIGMENAAGNQAHYHSSLTQGQSFSTITNIAYRFTPKVFGPFYTWTPSTSLNLNNIHNPEATPTINGTTTYSVLLNDGVCTYMDTTNVTTVSSLASSNISCDSATLSSISFSWTDIGLPVGGFYEYSLDSGVTWINAGTNLNATAIGLVSDSSYYILVRGNDGSGANCAEGPSSSINCSTINPDCTNNPAITISLIGDNLLCNNDASGCVHASTGGGSGNTMGLNWSQGSSNIDSICNLTAGSYTLVVTDTIGFGISPTICIDSQSITITEPSLLTVTALVTNPSCIGMSNGSIEVTTNGGTAGFNYIWSNNSTTEDIDSLSDNTYYLTVTDTNGCTDTLSSTLLSTNSMTVNIVSNIGTLSCDTLPVGSLTASISGGSNFSYIWNNGDTTANITGLAAGNYSVTVSNGNSCSAIASSVIYAPLIPDLNAYVSVTGLQSVAVEMGTVVTISAGASNLIYSWTGISNPSGGSINITNPNQETTTVSPDPEGVYTYTISASATTNDTTCTDTDSVTVIIEAPFKGFSDAFSPNNDGQNDFFAPVTLSDSEVQTFRVYNRWGQLIYNGDESHGNGWDGTHNGVAQPRDVYMYLVIYKRASASETVSVRGQVTLLR